MAKDWIIRRYRKGDEQQILKLVDLAYGREESVSNRAPSWNWLYRDNPHGYFIGLAEYNGQIIGHMGLIPTLIKVRNKEKIGVQAVGLVVHPNFRRSGVFVSVGSFVTKEAGKEGIEFGYGFPNAPAHGGHLKYGWFDVGNVPIFTKFCTPTSLLATNKAKALMRQYHLPKILVRYLFGFAMWVRSSYSKIRHRVIQDVDVKVQRIQRFNDRINEFWNRASISYNIAVVRNKQYLDWRYFRRPDAKYAVWIAKKDSEILGYIIATSRRRDEMKNGYIVDIFTLSDNKNIPAALISKAIGYLAKEKVDRIICWILGSIVVTEVLKKWGFIHVMDIPLIARINSSSSKISKSFLEDKMNWYVTIGDSDLV